MRALVAVVVAVVVALVPSAALAAADGGREITRWDATYDLQPDGSMRVHLEIDFDFGNDPGHGPYFTFPTRQGYDDEYDRVFDVHDISASSPTGAPANVYTEQGDSWLVIRIGDENIGDVSGEQTYTLDYTVDAVMNAVTDVPVGDQAVSGDEFYLNVIGDGFTLPIAGITITVNAPAESLAVQCFAGRASAGSPCASATAEGARATFTQPALAPGQGLTVDALYPSGTFDTEPHLIIANDFARAFSVEPATVIPALAILVGGVALIWRALRRRGLDEHYTGVAPGVAPPEPSAARVARGSAPGPVAVQFTPPDGLRPGLLGTLWDERAQLRDVTATVVDLAVRGYLRVDAIEADDYRLTRLRDAGGELLAYERELFDAVFEGRDQVSLGDLKTTFAADKAKVQAGLYRAVTDRGWFRANPQSVRMAWTAMGVALTVVGLVATIVLAATTTLALLGTPLVVLGVIMLATINVAPARTAEGSRVLAQTKGFELYLATTEARQLRFEEGQDIFSRYLPYAIAFGVTQQWTKKFEQLAREGVSVPTPTWYGGYGAVAFWAAPVAFSQAIGRFESLAGAAMAAPTPGSSGGSGFSGGSAGGGSFGGGGGGW